MAARGRTPKVSEAIEGEIVGEPVTEETATAATLRDIGKLKIMMRRPADAQVALLGRLAVAAQREPEKYFSRLVDTFFRIVEGLLVHPDDIAAIEGAIIDDGLTIEDMVKGLGDKDQDAAAKTTRARARRTR
jgi:hypothetical protein